MPLAGLNAVTVAAETEDGPGAPHFTVTFMDGVIWLGIFLLLVDLIPPIRFCSHRRRQAPRRRCRQNCRRSSSLSELSPEMPRDAEERCTGLVLDEDSAGAGTSLP